MKCIFLEGNYMQSCNANKEVYVPSCFEQSEYCTSGRYKSCPFYSKSDSLELNQESKIKCFKTN